MHKQKMHRANSVSNNNKIRNNFDNNINTNSKNNNNQPDIKQLYEYQNSLKKDIFNKMSNQDYSSAITLINTYINTSKQYNQEDNPNNIEMLYTLAECNLNLSNLEDSKNALNELLLLIETSNNNNYIKENLIYRQKANMLLGAISLNLGEYNNALKSYFSCENDLPKICKEPELNVKLSAVYLNIGLCYIYLGNKNIAEKYLKKGLSQT
jgi:tetratricopeptide (TPR) repeat protein